MKPKIFIGSSTKALNVAEAIQKELCHDADPVLWSQGIFRTTNVPIEDLMEALNKFDFAIFVFLPEDITTIRDHGLNSVRDNVIFELGLFLGKLGRQRNFFVTPRLDNGIKMHLPSDLTGISPATYDSNSDNLQAAMGPALYEIKGVIRRLGSAKKHQISLYDGKNDFKPYYFKHKNAYIWKNRKKVSPIGDGLLHFLPDGVMRLERKNSEGRYEIELRRDGPEIASLPKKHEQTYRVIRMSCDVKVDRGDHLLRFVLKDIKEDEWVANQKLNVSNTEWTTLDFYFRVSPTVDILFRVDHEAPSVIPSNVYLRNLVIVEEN